MVCWLPLCPGCEQTHEEEKMLYKPQSKNRAVSHQNFLQQHLWACRVCPGRSPGSRPKLRAGHRKRPFVVAEQSPATNTILAGSSGCQLRLHPPAGPRWQPGAPGPHKALFVPKRPLQCASRRCCGCLGLGRSPGASPLPPGSLLMHSDPNRSWLPGSEPAACAGSSPRPGPSSRSPGRGRRGRIAPGQP